MSDLPERMKSVADPSDLPDEMSNREYWLRTELWQFAEEVDEMARADRLRGPRMLTFGCLMSAAFWAAVGLVVWGVL